MSEQDLSNVTNTPSTESDSTQENSAAHGLKKPNPLTPFPAREGGTRTPAPLSRAGEGLGERSSKM